jgi:hypothetical protein
VLFAVLARREIAAVGRLRSEHRRVVLPVCADVVVSLDHRVPELVLVVAELLLLLDLLDVDVLDRALGGEIEPHRAARRIDLNARHRPDELDRARILAFELGQGLVDPHGGGVIGFRIIRRHLAVFGAVLLDEGLVRRRLECCAIDVRRNVGDDLVGHERQGKLVIIGAAAENDRLVAGRAQLLGELQGHRSDHQREDRVDVGFDARNVRPEVLGAERHPHFLHDLAAAILEGLLESANLLVAEGVIGADRGDALIALLASPLPERMGRLRRDPRGEYGVRKFVGLTLGQDRPRW